MKVSIKTNQEINSMRIAGKKLANVFSRLKKEVRSGISTKDLDDIAFSLIREEDAVPLFFGYNGFPASICTSINEEVVHGIPSVSRNLKEGDILSIDIGLSYDHYCADMAETIPVGNVSEEDIKLIKTTKEALFLGLSQMRVNNRIGDIGNAIESYVTKKGFTVVLEYTGHGIGRNMHEPPEILNYGKKKTGLLIRKGMVFAVEPMVNIGTWQTKILDNKWTVVTKDGKKSAHFEHTVLVTDSDPEILTFI